MTISDLDDNNKQNLRKQAEAKLGFECINISEMSEDNIRKAFQEFHTHQIELEMQNEDLRLAQVELKSARKSFSDLYDFAPTGYMTVSAKGMIIKANLTVSTMLGGKEDSYSNNHSLPLSSGKTKTNIINTGKTY